MNENKNAVAWQTLKPWQKVELLEINPPPIYLHMKVGPVQLLELTIFLHLFTIQIVGFVLHPK